MTKSACCICSQICGDATNDLVAQIVDPVRYVRRVPMESESFAVIPSIGPLVDGHVLLCPKHHFKSFAQTPARLEDECIGIKKQLSALLSQTYGLPIHYFEHGSAKKALEPMCTVEHAHIHFVPTDAEIWSDIQHEFEWQPVDKDIANLAEFVGDMEYIWYESPEGFRVVATGIEGTFESQYLRKIFAKAVGLGNMWNWREFPRTTAMADTCANIERALTSRNTNQIAAMS
jgi:diadenosine tetraphosphate (Ap4A) HIT family hydrolase